MNNIAVVETREGCQSCAITSSDFIVRAWLEGDEPPELGGVLETVGVRAADALHGRDRVPFLFHGTRAELVALLRAGAPDLVVADPRFELEDEDLIETPEVAITAAPRSPRYVAGTLTVPFGFVGGWGDLVVLAWGGSLRGMLNDPRFAIGERSLLEPVRRSGELANLRAYRNT